MAQILNLFKKVKNDKNLKMIAVSLAFLMMVMSVAATSSNAYQVLLDGDSVGYVEKKDVFDKVIAELEAEQTLAFQQEVKGIANELEVSNIKSDKKNQLSEEKLKTILKERIDWKVDAVAINVNDETEFFLKNKDEAEKVLELVKNKYTPQVENEAIEKVEIEFEEEIAIVECETEKSNLLDPEEAVDYICSGLEDSVTYEVVAGDNIWDIAKLNNLTIGELEKINPGVVLERLPVGQELNLIKPEPLLNIVTKFRITSEEDIACAVQYIDSEKLAKGQTVVKEEGQNGKKEITYQIVNKNGEKIDKVIIEEKLISNPKNKVVENGTGPYTLASRSGGSGIGTGNIQWPLQGRLTSPYGPRGGGFHSGIDIGAPTGRPIAAADGGRVTFAGWKGAYGNCIDVAHGNGQTTRYAHMSQISVGVGQNVSQGETIGLVGSTGRSTGPHLHFEVREGGSHKNPMNYLR